jgi:hypothetical protein
LIAFNSQAGFKDREVGMRGGRGGEQTQAELLKAAQIRNAILEQVRDTLRLGGAALATAS